MLLLICILCVFHFIYLYPPTPRHKLEGEASGKKDRCQSMTLWLQNAHSGSALLLEVLKMLYMSARLRTNWTSLGLESCWCLFVSDACRTMPRSRSEAHLITPQLQIYHLRLTLLGPYHVSNSQRFKCSTHFLPTQSSRNRKTCWTIVHANRHWAVSKNPSKVRSFAVRGVRASATHIFTMSHIPSSPHHALCVYWCYPCLLAIYNSSKKSFDPPLTHAPGPPQERKPQIQYFRPPIWANHFNACVKVYAALFEPQPKKRIHHLAGCHGSWSVTPTFTSIQNPPRRPDWSWREICGALLIW